MTVLRVTNWPNRYENNRTRGMKVMQWVPVPNRLDNDGYTELVDHPRGAAHFGCWITALEVASRCRPRGTLVRDCGKAHDSRSLARITRIPVKLWDEAVPRLVEIGWLESIPLEDTDLGQGDATPAPSPHFPRTHSAPSCDEGKGMEGNGMEEKTPPTPPRGRAASFDSKQDQNGRLTTPEVFDVWNDTADEYDLPKIRAGRAKLEPKVRGMLRDLGEYGTESVLSIAFDLFAAQEIVQKKRYGLANFLPNYAKYTPEAIERKEGHGT